MSPFNDLVGVVHEAPNSAQFMMSYVLKSLKRDDLCAWAGSGQLR